MATPLLGFKKMFSLRFPSPKGVFAERLPISVQRRTDDLKWKITGNPKDKPSPGTLRMINYIVVYLHKKCLYICVFVCACVHLPMCAQIYVCMYACMHAGIYHHIKLQQNEKPDKTFSKSKKHLVRIGVGERTECLWWRSHKERCFAVHCTGSTGWNFSTIRDIKTTSCLPQEIRWSRGKEKQRKGLKNL